MLPSIWEVGGSFSDLSPSSGCAPLLRTMRGSHSEPGQEEVKLGRGSDSTEWMVLDHQRSKHSSGTVKTRHHSL